MSRNVVDSSAWLEYFANTDRSRHFAKTIEDVDNLIVPAIVLYEVCKKVRRERGEEAALHVAAAMQSGTVVDIDASLAVEASRLDMPLADSIIYASARRMGATVWTQDADFSGLDGVRYFPK